MKYLALLVVAIALLSAHASADERVRRSSRHGRRAGKGTGNGQKGAGAAKSSASTAAAAASSSTSNAASTGSSSSNNANSLSTSLTLDPSVVQTGSSQNGNPTGQQVASATSVNNFINFCATNNNGAPLMNGTQTQSKAACNPIPMGMIASQNNMPSGKFTNPANLATIAANTSFNITMKIQNLITGNFVNPVTNYFSAPAQLDTASGNIIGHSHFVVEAIDSLTSTTVTNPLQFAFFKGVDPPAVNGVMTVTVPGGLPAGTYRLGSMNAAANHQPVLATVAQHGMFDDVVYFTAK